MLSGHRIFGLIKTSQGGHQLTNTLLRDFFSSESNWKFVNFEGEEIKHKDAQYLQPLAVNG